MNADTAVIATAGLQKRFGRTLALDGVDLQVEPGQIHGFLGPNGSGKSTTIRVLLGLLHADSGTARLFGADPWADAPSLHRRLAYVPGEVNLWPSLTGGQAIDLLARARGGLDAKRRDELLQRFELDPSKRARSYSKGNRQKVALIAALACDVELLLLDEPTSGLDPLMERAFTDYLREQRQQGRTVLLSSHILSEVEALCDHVSIIKAGRIVESGTLAGLRHLRRTQVRAVLAAAVPPDLAHLPGVHDPMINGEELRCHVESSALNALLERLTQLGLRELSCTPPTLEEVFLRHYDSSVQAPPAEATS